MVSHPSGLAVDIAERAPEKRGPTSLEAMPSFTLEDVRLAANNIRVDPDLEFLLGDFHHDMLTMMFGLDDEEPHNEQELLKALQIIYGSDFGQDEFTGERDMVYGLLYKLLDSRTSEDVVVQDRPSTDVTGEELSVTAEKLGKNGQSDRTGPLLLKDEEQTPKELHPEILVIRGDTPKENQNRGSRQQVKKRLEYVKPPASRAKSLPRAKKIVNPNANQALIDALALYIQLDREEASAIQQRLDIETRDDLPDLNSPTLDKLQQLQDDFNRDSRRRLQPNHYGALCLRLGLHEQVDERSYTLLQKVNAIDGGEATGRLATEALQIMLSTLSPDRDVARPELSDAERLQRQLKIAFGLNTHQQKAVIRHLSDASRESPDLPPDLQFALVQIKKCIGAVMEQGGSNPPSHLLRSAVGFSNNVPLSVQQLGCLYPGFLGPATDGKKKPVPMSIMAQPVAMRVVKDMLSFVAEYQALRLSHS